MIYPLYLIAYLILTLPYAVTVWGGILFNLFNGGRWRSEFDRAYYRVFRPYWWLSITAGHLLMLWFYGRAGLWVTVTSYAVSVALGWYVTSKIDDDDRWQRWLARGLGVVRDLGHRLVVVPETQEAR